MQRGSLKSKYYWDNYETLQGCKSHLLTFLPSHFTGESHAGNLAYGIREGQSWTARDLHFTDLMRKSTNSGWQLYVAESVQFSWKDLKQQMHDKDPYKAPKPSASPHFSCCATSFSRSAEGELVSLGHMPRWHTWSPFQSNSRFPSFHFTFLSRELLL